MKLHSYTLAALALLTAIILQACGPTKNILSVADDAYRQADDFFRVGRASPDAVEREASEARQVIRGFPPEPVLSTTELEVQKLWKDLRKDSICALVKWMVDNEGVPGEQAIEEFIDEQIDKRGLKLLRGRPRIEGEVEALAKDVHSVGLKIQAAKNGDTDAYVALLLEFGCFDPPSYP